MKMKNRSRIKLMLATALLAAAGVSGAATAFEKTTSLAGTTLVMNGTGTRYKAIFKVYDMAMYLPSTARTSEAVLALPGPKRLSFVAQRKVTGTDLGLAFIRGLKDNNPPELMRKHTPATTRLIEIFSGKAYVAEGHTFAMEFVPGKGTQFFIQGEPQGQPIDDAEFFQMILRIWLGNDPVDMHLKEGLLGN
ncbi:MAG: hypothetical protein CVU36_17730 [Betaproteobacteria bacterium HGW-Betaproteobacteria-9]|jgi:hypothetical protein|nr:MAG: hypothetical protein CVU36_17730 [Betaproteobacteria bacterium HGW-Betaproteobacteria-9]